MTTEEYVPMPEAWIESMRADAGAELSVAKTLYDSAVSDTRDALASDLDSIASVHRDAMGVLEGDNQRDLANADAAVQSVSQRLQSANVKDLQAAYSAVSSIGGAPPAPIEYVNASLDRGLGAQDAIDQLYGPRGQLTDMVSPVNPFSLAADSSAGVITATARIDLSGLIPATQTTEAAPCPVLSSSGSPISVSISPPPPPPLVLVPGSPVPPPPTPPPPTVYIGGSPTINTTDIGDAYTTTAVPPPPPPPPPPVVSIITIPTPVPAPVPPTPEARAATAAYVTRADAPIAPHAGASWADSDKCRLLSAVAGLAPDRPDLAVGVDTVLRGIVGAMADASASLGLFGGTISIANTVVSQIANVLPMVVTTLGSLTNIASVDSPPIAIASLEAIGITGWLDRITGSNFGYLTQGVQYDLQWSAPQYIPSQGELDTLLQHNWIDKSAWTCYTRALGNIPALRDAIIYDGQSKPGIQEEIELENRGFNTLSQTVERLSHLGVNDPRNILAWREMAKFIPGPSDLVSFMTKDSFDPVAVQAGQYDKDFEVKFLNSPQAQAIAKAHGVSVDVMRLYWRAHWFNPSFHQISVGLHRLRPGRTPEGVEPVTMDVARATLEIDDMSPAWVPRLLATSYTVIPRHDLQMWYINGTIDKAELLERVQDCGYNKADSERMIESWTWDKRQKIEQREHGWSRNRILDEYIKGSLNRKDAQSLLDNVNADKVETLDALDTADSIRRVQSINTCIKSFKSRYFRGEFTQQGVVHELLLMGLDVAQADPIADGWTCELYGRTKQPTLMLLRKWYHRNIITRDNLYMRLVNLRYTDDDAQNIVLEMDATEQEIVQKRAEAAAKSKAAKEKADEAARQKAIKDAQSQYDKMSAEEKKAAKDAAAAEAKAVKAAAAAEAKAVKAAAAAAKSQAKQQTAQEKQQAKAEKSQEKSDAAEAAAGASTPPDAVSVDAQPSGSTGNSGL